MSDGCCVFEFLRRIVDEALVCVKIILKWFNSFIYIFIDFVYKAGNTQAA